MQFETGDWVVDLTENTLTNKSTNISQKLEPIAVEALHFFAKNSGKTIPHQELIDNIWKGRVVTDHSIYQVITKLRQALAPEDKKSYIKTIPKRGYKYIQSFIEITPNIDVTVKPDDTQLINSTTNTHFSVKKNKSYFTPIILSLIGIGIVFVTVNMLKPKPANIQSYTYVKPLTAKKGAFRNPVYITENSLLFTSQEKQTSNIFTKNMSTGIVSRITDNNSFEDNLTATPDGKTIAFTRTFEKQCDIFFGQINAENIYTITKLFECNAKPASMDLAISKNGDVLFYIQKNPAGTQQIFSHNIATGKKLQLTKINQEQSLGEFALSLSPDNKVLAFIRRPNWTNSTIGIINLETSEEKVLFTQDGFLDSIAWSSDNQFIYFKDSHSSVSAFTVANNEVLKKIIISLDDNLAKIHSSPFAKSVILEKENVIADQGIWEVSNPLIEMMLYLLLHEVEALRCGYPLRRYQKEKSLVFQITDIFST